MDGEDALEEPGARAAELTSRLPDHATHASSLRGKRQASACRIRRPRRAAPSPDRHLKLYVVSDPSPAATICCAKRTRPRRSAPQHQEEHEVAHRGA